MQSSSLSLFLLGAAAIACGTSDALPTSGSAGAAGSGGATPSAGAPTSGAAGSAIMGTAENGGAASGGCAGGAPLPGGAPATGGSSGAPASGGSAGAEGGTGGSPAFVGCSKKYPLCEDFEGAAPGTNGSIWTVRNGFPTNVVTDVVHSGSHAIRVKANGQGSGGIQEKQILPAKDYWLRVYVRLDAANTQHEGFVVANGQPESFRLLNNPGGNGGVMLDRTSNDQGWEISKTTTLPKASWHCWEWHETPTEIHTYLDGAEILDVLAKWPEPKITSLSFGFERYHDGGEGFIYYDDIALDTARIGCN